MPEATSESASPSMRSPSSSTTSSIKLTDGDDAIAVNEVAVRNVSSLTKSNPALVVLPVVLTICMAMYDVGIAFHASSEACSVAWASPIASNGAPNGFGTVGEELFIE